MPKIQKVTDRAKRVTDPVLLSALAKQGIDKDYVEFFQDYAPRSLGKEHSPYAKFYRDLKSGKRFMVVSGLPMVKPDGVKIEPKWYPPVDTPAGKYRTKPNLFLAEVSNREVTLTCLHDQPYGVKKGDTVTYQPQLFLNGGEITPLPETATLLETDPINENYHQNTLEWDYGFCKRRIRIIEGRFRERWIFPANPNGEVRIKHNQTGNFKLKLGRYAISDDEELIPAEAFIDPEFGYPFKIGASATYYPDAHPETSSVDGIVWHSVDTTTWAGLRDAAGNGFDDTDDQDRSVEILSHGTQADDWFRLKRGIFVLDVSPLNGYTATVVVFTLYGYGKSDSQGWKGDINIYESHPASNTGLANGDYETGSGKFETTPLCNTPITYDDFNYDAVNPGDPNDFTLNAAGIALVQAAMDGSTVAKLGARNANYDVADSSPPNPAGADNYTTLTNWMADKGAGYKPKLVVTYTTGEIYELSCTDGLKVGDTPGTQIVFDQAVSDRLRLGEAKTERLRPYATGDEEALSGYPANGGNNWNRVDEAVADEAATYVSRAADPYARDLYNLDDHSVGSGTINSVTVYARCWGEVGITQDSLKIVIKSGTGEGAPDTVDESSEIRLTGAWVNYSNTWSTNPATSAAWTWDEIDKLQAGVALRSTEGFLNTSRCTQVYVVVSFGDVTPAIYLELNLALTDGLKAGEALARAYEANPSAIDGIVLGDTPLTQAIFQSLASDGVKIGEALSTLLETSPALTDGIKLSEALETLLQTYPAISDGVKIGDTSLGSLLLDLSLSDGTKLSDTPIGSLVLALALADGVKLSDTTTAGLVLALALTDGVTLSEALAVLHTLNPVLADGVKLGDTPSTTAILNALAQDGLKLSDTALGSLLLSLSVSDGVKVRDTPLAQLVLNLVATDGVKLSDVASYLGRVLALKIITSQYRGLKVTTSQNRVLKTITSQYRALKILTTQNRLVKVITSQYRKVKAITGG